MAQSTQIRCVARSSFPQVYASPISAPGGELDDRIEGLATGLVDEHALVRDRPHHIVLNEIIHEVAGTPLVDVRRRDPGRIPVLCNEFGFEPLVIVCRIVEDIRSSHGNSPWNALRARLTPPGADKPIG